MAFKKNKTKKGQIQVTFNWFYVLIAGGVILLFFFGIVMKQQKVSEENLAYDVVRIMESIFTGAGVSEKTKNFIDTSGLVDYTLYFNCDEGVSEFGIRDKGSPAQNVVDPIFSPREIKTTQLILWSLPYKLPFKVIDLMFVTSWNTKYFVLGNNAFTEEFMNATTGINVVQVPDLSFVDSQKNYQIRVIDLMGAIQEGLPVPDKVTLMQDNKVTAISFIGTHSAQYYQKEGNSWKTVGEKISVISLGGERDAAKYAAIFSQNKEIYECNMKKVFKRFSFLLEIYEQKLKEIELYYAESPEKTLTKDCLGYIQSGQYEQNLQDSLTLLKGNAGACLLLFERCADLIEASEKLKEANKNLGSKGDCLTLY